MEHGVEQIQSYIPKYLLPCLAKPGERRFQRDAARSAVSSRTVFGTGLKMIVLIHSTNLLRTPTLPERALSIYKVPNISSFYSVHERANSHHKSSMASELTKRRARASATIDHGR